MSNPYYVSMSSPYINRVKSSSSSQFQQQRPMANLPGQMEIINPFGELQVNYFSTLDSLKMSIPYSNMSLKHSIESSYNCFAQINGQYGRTFFLMGYLLIEDIISQVGSSSFLEVQKPLLDSFHSIGRLQELDHQEKTLFTKLRFKLQDFFVKVENLKNVYTEDHNKFASFLCEEIKKDSELMFALIQGSRCYLIQSMLSNGISISETPLYDKLVRSGWAIPDAYDDGILDKFCEVFNLKLVTFSMTSFEIKEKLIGSPMASKEASLIFFSTRYKEFIAILYKPKKHCTVQRDITSSYSLGKETSSTFRKTQICTVCTLCHEEIIDELVYKNPFCEHAYCYYCLKDCGDPNLNFCYFIKCPKRIVQNDIIRFYKKCAENEKVNGNKQVLVNQSNGIPSEGKEKCSNCFEESSIQNPLFVNKECQHSFCKSCLMSNKLSFRGKCLNWSCSSFMDLEDLKEYMRAYDVPNSSILTRCGNCFKSFNMNEFFQSLTCRHLLCHVCLEKLTSLSCPISDCRQHLDQEAVLNFKANFLIEQESQNMCDKTFYCSPCNKHTNLYLPKDSKLDYWKCQNCNIIHCVPHEKLMKECLCSCPKCLSDLLQESNPQRKLCQKCLISYCKKCNQETAIGQDCGCHIEIEKQEIQMFNHNEEPKLDKDVTGEFKNNETLKKQIENSCSACNDFREFPAFLQLDCDHRLCEYCILMRREEFLNINYIACSICHN